MQACRLRQRPRCPPTLPKNRADLRISAMTTRHPRHPPPRLSHPHFLCCPRRQRGRFRRVLSFRLDWNPLIRPRRGPLLHPLAGAPRARRRQFRVMRTCCRACCHASLFLLLPAIVERRGSVPARAGDGVLTSIPRSTQGAGRCECRWPNQSTA